MKRIYILIFVLLVAGFVRGDAGVTRAQDPLVVNSKSISLKLENSRVRVLEATLEQALRKDAFAIPPMSSMSSRDGKFRNHSADGTVTEAEFRTGDVIYRDPITHWAENIAVQQSALSLWNSRTRWSGPKGCQAIAPTGRSG